MASTQTTEIHDSAHIDPSATIGEGVVIERGAYVGPNCVIGNGTRLRISSIVAENVTLGADNDVHSFAVLGGDPQDRAFDGAIRGEVVIGDRNIFREGVTINRSTGTGRPTKIGDDNFLMTNAHLGHNAQIGNRVTMTNSSSLAGHATVGDGCVLSTGVGIHQFTRVGEMVMFRGHASVGMHVPPYVMVGAVNAISGLNKVGLDRNKAFTDEDRAQIKRVYRMVYRERGGASIHETIEKMRALELGAPALRFVDFIEESVNAEGPYARGIARQL